MGHFQFDLPLSDDFELTYLIPSFGLAAYAELLHMWNTLIKFLHAKLVGSVTSEVVNSYPMLHFGLA